LIVNENISKRIVEYESQSIHMDEDYYEDKEQSELANQILDKVVNYNYPNIAELGEMLRLTTNYGTINKSFNNPIYSAAKVYDSTLNQENINMLNISVNSLIRLKYLLSIRIQIELPELIKKGEELINLLNQEYNLK